MNVVSNWRVYGLEDSIRASKYPMSVDTERCTDTVTPTVHKLARCRPGTGHDQFLTGCVVQFDLTFTVKAWTEAERYHFFDFVSSQSTMHRITKFDLDTAYIEYVDPRIIPIVKELVAAYNADPTAENYLKVLYSNPVGFRLTARMTTNYRQLKTIYQQRKNHRLPEWRWFCQWVESLPHSEFITACSTREEEMHRLRAERDRYWEYIKSRVCDTCGGDCSECHVGEDGNLTRWEWDGDKHE